MAESKSLCLHIVTLECKDSKSATDCLEALKLYGRPDARLFRCVSYEFGLKVGHQDTIYLVEHWNSWEDLDALLKEKVIPALPTYNTFLKRPFNPQTDAVRIRLC